MRRSIRSNWFLLAALSLTLVYATGCASSQPGASEETKDDTVNVGYGTQPRSEVTGAVSKVDPDDVARPVTRLEDLLVGQVAGVQIYPTPSGGLRVEIRGKSSIYGSNEPLYVVDGMTMTPAPGGGLPSINPSDIESIEVLKDGSAAMYGSRGANGVIIVTTKRGGK